MAMYGSAARSYQSYLYCLHIQADISSLINRAFTVRVCIQGIYVHVV